MTDILIVDDDPFMRELCEVILARPGRTLTSAADGASALARLASAPPHLVLLDLSLPGISGLEVLKHLRVAPGWGAVRIVMLTGSGELDHLIEAKRLGAVGYIQKPIAPEALAARVQELLDQPDIIWMDDHTRARRANARR